MATPKALSAVVVLRNFFGMKADQTTAGFLAELKALSPAERQELAELAAKEMGVELAAPAVAATT
jgi:hypothetical protein